MKDGQAHDGVHQPQHQSVLDVKNGLRAQQAALQHPVQKLVEEVKEECEQQPDKGVLHVDTQADGSGEIAHQGVDDTIHAEQVFRKGVLGQADEETYEEAANLAAAHEGEIDGDEQRQLEDAEELEETRDVNLEEDGGYGNGEQ